MDTNLVHRSTVFAERIKQLIRYYEKTDAEFATELGIGLTDLTQLLENKPVHQEIVLSLIDQIKNRYHLEFDWFIHFDLGAIPDLRDWIQGYQYGRDVEPKRERDHRVLMSKSIRRLLKDLVPEDEKNFVERL